MTEIKSSDILFFDSSSPKELLFSLCEEATRDSMPGSQNLSIIDWEKNPSSLLYKIYIEKVYDEVNGGRFIGVKGDDGQLILVFGGMRWDSDHNVCLMPTRLYLSEKNRNYGKGETFTSRYKAAVTKMNEECIRMGYKAALITHNKYNLWIRENTYRVSREEGYMIFDYYEYPVLVNYTKQWAMYHLYDLTYESNLIASLDKVRLPN